MYLNGSHDCCFHTAEVKSGSSRKHEALKEESARVLKFLQVGRAPAGVDCPSPAGRLLHFTGPALRPPAPSAPSSPLRRISLTSESCHFSSHQIRG